MIFDSGTTTVSTAGTEQQISNTTNKVRWIKVKALAANSGISYLGVADVSGKGIKSSLLMSKASSLYRCLSKTNFSAADLLIQLNNEICETISRGMFVTMLIGIYDSNKKELLFRITF